MTAERIEVVDARKRRTAAYVALTRAAGGCPPWGSRAHAEYQRTVMQPLRDALAGAHDELDRVTHGVRA